MGCLVSNNHHIVIILNYLLCFNWPDIHFHRNRNRTAIRVVRIVFLWICPVSKCREIKHFKMPWLVGRAGGTDFPPLIDSDKDKFKKWRKRLCDFSELQEHQWFLKREVEMSTSAQWFSWCTQFSPHYILFTKHSINFIWVHQYAEDSQVYLFHPKVKRL